MRFHKGDKIISANKAWVYTVVGYGINVVGDSVYHLQILKNDFDLFNHDNNDRYKVGKIVAVHPSSVEPNCTLMLLKADSIWRQLNY